KVLQRSHRNTLHKFFRFLEAVHSNMTPTAFEVLKDKSLEQRVDYLITTAKTAGCTPSQPDKAIIEELYKGGGALIPSLFESLPVIEAKPSRHKKKKEKTVNKQKT